MVDPSTHGTRSGADRSDRPGQAGQAGPGDAVRHFRLLPRRKLPTLPPRGERWAGLVRPATLVTVALVGVLVAVVWIGVATVSPSTPTTLEGVTAETTDQAVELLSLLPGGSASAAGATVEDTSTVQECPLRPESGAEQYALHQVVSVPGGVSVEAFARDVRAHFEGEDWNVNTSAFGGQGGVRLRLLGPSLVPLTVTVVPTAQAADGDEPPLRLTLASESRCTRPE
ncbi:MAG: hypothetical protein Q7T71_19550 [Herbiconiux sp.]|nr:hypothetical protein [Herbiconiux sp.]